MGLHEGFSPLYSRVALCDGALCQEEMQDLLLRFPGTEFLCLASGMAKSMVKKLHVPLDELRSIYRLLRETGGAETARFAESMQMPVCRAECAFEILCDMGLAEKTEFPKGISLLPARENGRRNQSALQAAVPL